MSAGDDIVAVTRRLTPESALEAYGRGVFPMAAPRLRIVTWHQPEPRAIIPLERFHISRSLKRTLRKGALEASYDRAFAEVMRGCAEGRPVWISAEFHRVYSELHRRGRAHSVEVWHQGRLVGGTYGVQLGGAFCAESKFHRLRDASKVALCRLVERLRERGFVLLDVQYLTPHLAQFGTIEIPHREYLRRLRAAMELERCFG